MSGVGHTLKFEELANSYESECEETKDEEKKGQGWKKLINGLNRIDTKKHAKVRHTIINAITVAREAGQNKVVAELRGALKKYRESAAGAAKMAALEVLSRHGSYDVSEKDQSDDVDIDDDATSDAASVSQGEGDDSRSDSLLGEEAAALGGCIDGSDDATRDDWVSAVKNCKTIAR